jgi:hypothetical protein
MTGHAACGKIAITNPHGQAVTWVDVVCLASIWRSMAEGMGETTGPGDRWVTRGA